MSSVSVILIFSTRGLSVSTITAHHSTCFNPIFNMCDGI